MVAKCKSPVKDAYMCKCCERFYAEKSSNVYVPVVGSTFCKGFTFVSPKKDKR